MIRRVSPDERGPEFDYSSRGWEGVSAACKITPERQVDLASSEFQSEIWEGTESDLEASALALWGPEDEFPLLFVTLDLLYPGRTIRAAVERAAAPLPSNRIIVAASHTHRGPATDDTKPRLGKIDTDYFEQLIDQLEVLVRKVLSGRRKQITITVGDADAHHSINRRWRKRLVVARKPRINEVVNAPNPEGLTDERVTVVMFREQQGAPLAVLWNYACHPVGGPARNAVSAHFPGEVRNRLRSRWGIPELPVLYFQGFSGNTRPNATARVHSLQRRLRQVVSGRLFEDMTRDAFRIWTQGLSNVVLRAVDSGRELKPTKVTANRLIVRGEEIAYSKSALDGVSFARVDLGRELAIVAVSGELVAEYTKLLRPIVRAQRIMFVGCTDHVIGYLPTDQIQGEGGYESGGFCEAFDLDGLTLKIESTVIKAVSALSSQALHDTSCGQCDAG